MRHAFRWASALLASTLLFATPVLAQTLHRGNGAEPETLDPAKSTGVPESHLQRDLFEGLIAEAADGRLIPGVAEKWTVSADGLAYTFTLRANAKWSDGNPVTAQDFVYSYRRLLDPATASKYAFMMWPLKNGEKVSKGEIKDVAQVGAEAVDATTLKLTLEQPTPYLLGLLAHHAAYPVSKKAIDAAGDRWTRPGNLIGNGAYKLAEWTPQSHIKLVKSDTFHDAANVAIKEAMFYPTEDIGAELKRYRAGELDLTYQIPPDQIAFVKANLPAETKIAPYFGTYYYALNLTAEPFKSNVKLRHALSLAIDRDILVEKVTTAGEVPAYGWVPPNTANYSNVVPATQKMTQAERDAMAKKLMAEAGYGPGKPLEVEILYNTSDLHKRIAIAVSAMWDEKLGVKAKQVNAEWKVYLNAGAEKKFQVRRAGWIGDYNDAWSFLELLKGDVGKQNPSGYANARYDELMRKSTTLTDLGERAKVMAEAETIMLDEMPLIPIYHSVSKGMVKPYVQGWQTNVSDVHPTRWMSLKK